MCAFNVLYAIIYSWSRSALVAVLTLTDLASYDTLHVRYTKNHDTLYAPYAETCSYGACGVTAQSLETNLECAASLDLCLGRSLVPRG